jgi:beta-glucosidase-like glycosyl hydrolase
MSVLVLTKMQETYGEDPWLSGYLTTAYVTGIQGGNNIIGGVNLKHFHFIDL